MNFPDYMEFYLSAANGLDNIKVETVRGFSNSVVYGSVDALIRAENDLDTGLVTIKAVGPDGSHYEIEIQFDESLIYPLGDLHRVNSIECESVNYGTISIDGNYKVNPGIGRSEYAVYTTPIDYDTYIISISAESETGLYVNDKRHLFFTDHIKFEIPYKVDGDITFKSDEDAYIVMQMILLKRGV